MNVDWEARFDKEITNEYLRGATSAENLVGIKNFIKTLLKEERKETLYKLRTLFRDGSDFDFIVTKIIEEAEGLKEE